MSTQYRELNEICKFIDYRGKTPEKTTSGIPLITAKIVKNGRLEPYGEFISEDEYIPWMTRGIPSPGDVIVTTEAPLGEIAEVPSGRVAFAQRIIVLCPDRKIILPKYLKYVLQSPQIQNELKARSSGSVVTGIKSAELNKLSIPIVNLERQKYVSHILSTIEQKTESNDKLIGLLESAGSAIFKEWFTDYGPVISRSSKIKHSTLSDEQIKFFPADFIGQDDLRIPKGWRWEKVEDNFDITIGRTPPRKEHNWFTKNRADIPWISIRDIGEVNTYIEETSEYLTRAAIDKFNIPVIAANTVILSFKLTVGRVAITTNEMLSNEAIAHFRINNRSVLSTAFTYFFLKNYNFAILGSTSSIATAFNTKVIRDISIPTPSKEIVKLFDELVEPMLNKIKNLSKENLYLRDLRTCLLPKLVTGEV